MLYGVSEISCKINSLWVNLSKTDFELETAVVQGSQFSHLWNGVININQSLYCMAWYLQNSNNGELPMLPLGSLCYLSCTFVPCSWSR